MNIDIKKIIQWIVKSFTVLCIFEEKRGNDNWRFGGKMDIKMKDFLIPPPQILNEQNPIFLAQSYLWGEIGFPRVGKWVFRENIHVYIPDFIVFYCFCKNYLIGLPCRIYPIFCTFTIVFTSFSVSTTWKYFII